MGYARIEQFANETHIYSYTASSRSKRRHVQKNKRDSRRGEMLVYKSRYSMHRAKTSFFKLVFHNLSCKGPPALFTFTVYEADLRFSEIYKAISQFKKRVQRKRHQEISYIAVPERGSLKGRVHVHALVWGFTRSEIAQERSTRNLQRLYSKGFIDVRCAYDSSPKLASYLAKYLTKTNGHLRYGERAYTVGGKIERPRSFGSNSLLDYADQLVPDVSCLQKVVQYDTKYLGTCTLSIYSNNQK